MDWGRWNYEDAKGVKREAKLQSSTFAVFAHFVV